jgi:PAS domain S-box-containing protein
MARLSGLLGLMLGLVNFFLLLGYLHGLGLFQNVALRPVTPVATVAGLLAGVALVCTAGQERFPLSWIGGDRIRGKLLRALLPTALVASITIELLHHLDFGHPVLNEVILMVLSPIVLAAALFWAVRRTARELERAESALCENLEQLDAKVHERTADLARLNENLRTEIALRKQSEEELQLFADAVQSAQELISITDPENRFTFCNRAFLETYGYSAPEILGRTPECLDSPQNPPGIHAEILRQTLHGGWQGDLVNRRKDGSELPISLITSLIRNSEGRIIGLIGTARDITIRKQMAEKLSASEEKFRQVVEHIREIFWITDPTKLDVIYISPGYEAIWGRSCSSLIRDPVSWLTAIHPEDRDRVRSAAFTKQVDGRYHETYRIVRPDGSIRWIEDRAFPLKNDRGEVYRIVGIAEDVTVRTLAAEVLRESEARFRTLFESAPIGIAACGPDDRYLSVNQAYCAMLGYTEPELLKLTTRQLTHPQDLPELRRLRQEIVDGRRDRYEREERFLARDGRLVQTLSAASAVRDRAGRLRYLISMVVDITESKRLRDELLEISAHERRRFGHDLHDGLGQYLSGISFKAKCLEEALAAGASPHAPDARELVGLVNRAIGQTRDLARGLDPVQVEIGGLVAAVENLVLEAGRRSAVKCHFHSDRSSIPLATNLALQLFRIAQEAINNALKHAQAGELDVELSEDQGGVRLAILDNGRGFQPHANGSGGLGLRTMRYRADSIGATLRIQPRPTHGTMVECILSPGIHPTRFLEGASHGETNP